MLHGSHDLFHDYMYIMCEFYLSPEHINLLMIIVIVNTVEYNLNYMFESLFPNLSVHWI